MKLVAVLLGFLLATLAYSKDNCRELIPKSWYYIYNTSVEINAYYCSYSNEDNHVCENFGNKIQTSFATTEKFCKPNVFMQLSNFRKYENRTATLCKMPARVNLLEDIVTLPDNKTCRYSHKKCYDDNNSKYIFWDDTDICNSITFIHENIFSPVINKFSQGTFIKDMNISLILIEKLEMCSFEVWKTNHDSIIASKKKLTATNTKAKLLKLESNFEEFCNKTNNQQSSIKEQIANNITRIWYVYKYPTDVTIHICLTNSQTVCKDLNFGETVTTNNLNLLNQCKNNFCDSPACKYGHSITTLCRKTHQVDLEENSLRGFPSECKYSEGLCKPLNTFWQYTDRCNAIQIAHKGYEQNCGNKKCVIKNINSTKLMLSRKGTLCGKTVWYTDQDGLVASETELEFSPSKSYKDKINNQSDEISSLQDLLRYFVFSLVALCVLWYIFNVTVNFSSLRKLNKTLPSKKKVSLLNCLSQSLTAYHLSFSQPEKQLSTIASSAQVPQLYQSVDNELYNKPVKLPLKKLT